MKNVLVTGGAGFIGSHIVDGYIKEGWRVTVVDNLFRGKKENLNPQAKFYQLDIQDKKLSKVFSKEKFDLINHHAAQIDVRKSVEDSLFDAEVNILGTLNLLDNCVKWGVNKIIFISSGGAIYGEPSSLPVNEYYLKNPFSPYGISKHTIEHYLYYYRENFGINFVSLRYANIYGPRQDPLGEAGVISIFTQKMLKGEKPSIFGNGEQLRDYLYVEEAVEANLLATNLIEKINKKKIKSPDDLAYNIGTGRGTSVNSLYKLISNFINFREEPLYLPPRKGEINRIYLQVKKAEKELAWKSKINLEEGLAKTIEWFKKHY